jgi:hypothetical protein
MTCDSAAEPQTHPTNTPGHGGERPGRRLRQGQPSNPPLVCRSGPSKRPQGAGAGGTPGTGCCDGDGRLVTDVPRCVVEDRCRLGVHGGGLRDGGNPAAPACGPGGLPCRSVPTGRYSVGADAQVDAAVPDDCRCAGCGRWPVHPYVS